ncbi:MAG: AAA family ATPase [Gaiellaceae bacterium]
MSAATEQFIVRLAAAGFDTRSDERGAHAWDADCPSCNAVSDGLWPLRITEAPAGVPVLRCTSGCTQRAIVSALADREAELSDAAGVEYSSPARPGLRVLDVERMLTSEPPPVPWIAEPLLARGAVTMLVGREGLGKSMFALALAAAIGHGSSTGGIACRSGRVLVIDAENGEAEAHRRVRCLGVKPGALVYVEAERFNLRTDLREVEALLGEHHPDVLVLDSLRSLAPGLEENDSGPVEAALGPLRALARRHRCAVLVLHHAGKANNAYRGSTAIGAAVELGFTLARDGDDPHRRALTCWKSRLAAEPAPRTLSLRAGEGRIAITTAEPATSTAAGSRTDELADRLAAIVAERGVLAWGELAALAGVEPESGTAKRARRRAIDKRQLAGHGRGLYGPTVRPGPVGGADGRTVAGDEEVAA